LQALPQLLHFLVAHFQQQLVPLSQQLLGLIGRDLGLGLGFGGFRLALGQIGEMGDFVLAGRLLGLAQGLTGLGQGHGRELGDIGVLLDLVVLGPRPHQSRIVGGRASGAQGQQESENRHPPAHNENTIISRDVPKKL
jgi:hypothetical protein